MFGSFVSHCGAACRQLQLSFFAQAVDSISRRCEPRHERGSPANPQLFPAFAQARRPLAQVIHRFVHTILVGSVWDEIPVDACVPPAPCARGGAGWTGSARRKPAALGRAAASAHVEQTARPSMGRSSFWKLAGGPGPEPGAVQPPRPRPPPACWRGETPLASWRPGLPVGRRRHLHGGDEEHDRSLLRPQQHQGTADSLILHGRGQRRQPPTAIAALPGPCGRC
jgi:hypothetical protein